MPELRKDPVINRWVIIATERGKRPSDFGSTEAQKKGGFCPFCYGNEDKTPPEILAFRKPGTEPNTPGWLTRVVSNKFPALQVEGDLNREGVGMYDKMNGIGAHEVIIETPDHDASLGAMDYESVLNTVRAYQQRMLDLAHDARFRYILIFKNCGDTAGASLEHPHSQLIATPIVPKRAVEELNGAMQYYNFKERCVFCDIVRQELSDGLRVVIETDDFVSFEPFASRFPFETWIVPKTHSSDFDQFPEEKLPSLAYVLKESVKRLELALNQPPYNYMLHTAPPNQKGLEHYHWHIEIIPKLTKIAGFEWGSGFYINPTPPEDAAKYLREPEKSIEEVAAD